jgi:hypothetical protein
MGTNTLIAVNQGDVISSDDPNQYRTALTGDVVPRNSAGVAVNEAGDLGTSSIRWKNVRGEAVLTNLVQPETGNLILNSDGQFIITNGGTDDIAVVTTQDLSINANKISLNKAGGGGTIASSTGGAMVFDSGLSYQATGNGSVNISSSGIGTAIFQSATGSVQLIRNGQIVFESRTSDDRVQISSTNASSLAMLLEPSIGMILRAPNGAKLVIENDGIRSVVGAEIKLLDAYNTTTGSAANVHVSSDGRLRRSTSSKKYKKNIKDLDKNEILKLRPVTFDDKQNENVKNQIGLIAEDVDNVEPRLAIKNEKGEIEGVNYQAIGPMLIPLVKELFERVESLEKQLAEANK